MKRIAYNMNSFVYDKFSKKIKRRKDIKYKNIKICYEYL